MSAHPAEGQRHFPADTAGQFFFDKAHGVKMARIALWIVDGGHPLSGKSIQAAMTALGITELQDYNQREIHGIVKVLREARS